MDALIASDTFFIDTESHADRDCVRTLEIDADFSEIA